MSKVKRLLLAAGVSLAFVSGCTRTEDSTKDAAAVPTPTASTVQVTPGSSSPSNTQLPVTTTNGAPAVAATPAPTTNPADAAAGVPPTPVKGGVGKTPPLQTGSGANDLWVFTSARSAIESDADLQQSQINLNVKNSVVVLSGTAASAEQKARAEEIVRKAEGVKGVKNLLQVKSAN